MTGGGTGIGRATPLAFARECASVVVADMSIQDVVGGRSVDWKRSATSSMAVTREFRTFPCGAPGLRSHAFSTDAPAGRTMKLLAAIALFSLLAPPLTQASPAKTATKSEPMKTHEDIRMVAPALEKYTHGALFGDVWKRPGLVPRDRGMVTLAALIARNQTVEMPYYLNLALDNGLRPREVSEIITHLAFYSGWPNAIAAVTIAKEVFAQRNIGPDQLPPASPPLLPLDEAAEAQRAAGVEQLFGSVAPGVVQYTTDLLFRDLWLRPDLAPRDRSLITVSALIASGQVAQISYHLNRAMDNGLTQEQAAEAITHLAFYAGWPNVFSALPVAKEVFDNRHN